MTRLAIAGSGATRRGSARNAQWPRPAGPRPPRAIDPIGERRVGIGAYQLGQPELPRPQLADDSREHERRTRAAARRPPECPAAIHDEDRRSS